MTQQSPIVKELSSSSHSDRLIRVRVAGKKADSFSSFTFSDTEVSGLMDSGEKGSALVLRSGVEIPVALPYEQLEQKIYQPDFRTDGPVLDLRDVTGEAAKPKAANGNESPAEMKIGDKMPDGTVFAGISPDTGKPMYAAPADAPLTMKFNQATVYAAKLDTHGHKDWRVPTKAELNVLFNNRAAVGGFNVTGSNPASWYWSASPNYKWNAWGSGSATGIRTTSIRTITRLCVVSLSESSGVEAPFPDTHFATRLEFRWMTTEACLTLGAVFDAYFDCRRTKRNSINQLRFEADLESNLVGLYRDLASREVPDRPQHRLYRDLPESQGSLGGRFPGPRGASRYLQRDRRPLLQALHTATAMPASPAAARMTACAEFPASPVRSPATGPGPPFS